jgi:uncharacterized protein
LEETALEIVSRVMDLYAQIDRAAAEFQLKSALRCPAGCGACCPTADAEATVVEMLPLAHEILRRGQAAFWLERLAEPPSAGKCILYAAQPAAEAAGHCSFYTWRPALCRLFGFAAVRDRAGCRILATCRHIRQSDPRAAAAAAALADQAPCFVHYSARVYALEPVLGARPMPINKALGQAIERLGLRIAYAYGETLRDNTAA